MRRIILSAGFFLCLSLHAFGAGEQWDNTLRPLTFGITGGYSGLSGYYHNTLNGAYSFGAVFIPYAGNFFMAEADIIFSQHTVRGSGESSLMSLAVDIGPVLHYPVFPFLRIFAAPAFRMNTMFVVAETTGRRSSTFKAGFSLSTGFYFPVVRNVHGRLGYRFSENDLSDRAFMSHEISLGALYSFGRGGIDDGSEKIRYSELKNNYESGVEAFEKGDFDKAGKDFEKVLELDDNHREAGRYLAVIRKSEEEYRAAEKLVKEQDYYGAIEKLKNVDPAMAKARELLNEVRKLLADRIKMMEEECVRNYNDRNYEACIEGCRKILLVDPENRTARIYLDRAEKRYKTLKKLE